MKGTGNDWEFWIDRGGTFTDIVAKAPDGSLLARKLLSENPERYEDAALQGIRDILEASGSARSAQILAVKMGTTVGTNALLQRTGERTALVTNRGFGDVLRIGSQNRPDIFALAIRPRDLPYERVIELAGRLDADGREVEPLDEGAARSALQAARDAGVRSLAVVLMHAWREPRHENAIGALARELGFVQVSLSHRVSSTMKLVARGNTTVVDAYLSPVLRRYVERVESGLTRLGADAAGRSRGCRLSFMQSNGGLIEARRFGGKDSLLSGPAGGIIGAIATARLAGFDRIVSFDMGGTSTDVAHFAGDIERNDEADVAGIRVHLPMMNIHTVAAGGGSMLRFDGLRYRVGPDSAGANPGPACYRRGGPLCVTDANLLVGKLDPAFFPSVFGPRADQALDVDTVRLRFGELASDIGAASGKTISAAEVADGFLAVSSECMANAIKTISVQRGHDLTGYTLCCFGAAAGQHACRVADLLGIRTILLHPLAGVLSAFGMGLADHRVLRARAVVAELSTALIETLGSLADALADEAVAELIDQGISRDRILIQRRLAIRYSGSDTRLDVPWGSLEAMRSGFEEGHIRRFGFIDLAKDLIVDAVRVEGVGASDPIDRPTAGPVSDAEALAVKQTAIFSGGAWRPAAVYRRADLLPGARIRGPAIVAEATATTVLEPGWEGEMSAGNDLILRRTVSVAVQFKPDGSVDPVRLEIFGQAFMAVAEQMGQTLQNTAHSVNIKERLDYSCAVFDRGGKLVANAPHIPVHLGSMGESVSALLEAVGDFVRPGEVFLTNSPYAGGTHLPDVTVVTPVFLDPEPGPLFYVASRGHHADIGGITPGSMPPHSRTILEEGVLTSCLRIVSDRRFDEAAVREWLAQGPYPARNPEQNLADLRAQIAANEQGVHELRRLVERYTLPVVTAFAAHVQDHAEAAVRQVIATLADGGFRYPLDDGSELCVAVRVDRAARSAVIDFTGTSGQHPGNLNAPSAVCKAAVLYVFRTLVRRDIPLNAGCLRPLELVIPLGCMLNPRYPAAVAAGNVETSQYIVDALYGALGTLAASQGTMNNFTFGNERWQYYETICGGAGAGADFAGCDAVHTHMTNSRITDPEVLEWRFPVRLEEFSIRRNSGGAGRQRGGNGVIRRLRFLQPMIAGILSSHRVHPPFGLFGGAPGSLGRNAVVRSDGRVQELPGCAEIAVAADDVFVIETPGGGGYGEIDR